MFKSRFAAMSLNVLSRKLTEVVTCEFKLALQSAGRLAVPRPHLRACDWIRVQP